MKIVMTILRLTSFQKLIHGKLCKIFPPSELIQNFISHFSRSPASSSNNEADLSQNVGNGANSWEGDEESDRCGLINRLERNCLPGTGDIATVAEPLSCGGGDWDK